MRNKILKYTTAATLILGFSPITFASDSPEWQLQSGLGIAYSDQPWVGIKSKAHIVPFFSAQYGNWSFLGDSLVSYQFIEQEEYSLAVGIDYRDDTYDSDNFITSGKSKSKVFNGYTSPDGDITFDISGHWEMINWNIKQDVSGNSKGLTADVEIVAPLLSIGDRFVVEGSLGAQWLSAKYSNHVYGISGKNINVSKGRNAYTLGASTNFNIGLNATYIINDNWAAVGGYTYTKLDKKIENSPLIDSNKSSNLYLGIVYQF